MSQRQVLVFGYGAYGQEVARSLRNLYSQIIIVDQYQRHLDEAKKDGFENLIQINVHDEEAFTNLYLQDNCVAFCAFEDEAYNTYLTISLRAEYEHLAIVAFGETKESNHKLIMAGANKVIIVEEAGANAIYNLLINPTVAKLFEDIFYYKSDLNMGEVVISETSKLSGSFLKDLSKMKTYNVIVLGVVDLEFGKNFIFATSGHNHKIDPGDALVILGPSSEVEKFQKEYS